MSLVLVSAGFPNYAKVPFWAIIIIVIRKTKNFENTPKIYLNVIHLFNKLINLVIRLIEPTEIFIFLYKSIKI